MCVCGFLHSRACVHCTWVRERQEEIRRKGHDVAGVGVSVKRFAAEEPYEATCQRTG